MQFLKVFLSFSLLTGLNSVSCSIHANSYEYNLQRTNSFFHHFEDKIISQLQRITVNMCEMDELILLNSLILSFPSNARENLFSKVMRLGAYENDVLFDSFLELCTETIGPELDNLLSPQSPLHDDENFIDYLETIFSNFNDAIVISVQHAIKIINSAVSQSQSLSPDYTDDFESDEEDDITSINPVSRITDEELEILEEIRQSSCKSNSPKPSNELILTSLSILYYGIQPADRLFSIARSFLAFVRENNLKIYDPRLFYINPTYEFVLMRDFDIGNYEFHSFCKSFPYLSFPITSPFYNGPPFSKSETLEAKMETLMILARDDLLKLVDSLKYDELSEQIEIEFPSANSGIVSFIIEQIKDEVSNFLMSLRRNRSLINGLNFAMRTAHVELVEIFGISDEDHLVSKIIAICMTYLRSPIALIRKYDSLVEWDSRYNESSSFLIERTGSKCSLNPSSRKSVKIMEDNNEIHVIKRISEIIEDEIEKENADLQNSTTSFGSNLQSITSINTRCESVSPVHFEESELELKSELKSELELELEQQRLLVDTKTSSETSKKHSQNGVPDFPFEDPVNVIQEPNYIKDTGDYLFEKGDDSCFVLNERIYSINEGLSIFLSESFSHPEVIKSIQDIVSDDLKFIFGP